MSHPVKSGRELQESINTYGGRCGAAWAATADDCVSVDVKAPVCSDLATDDIVEAIIENRDAENAQASSDEELADEPGVVTTREAVAAFEALHIYIWPLPDLAPQHAVNFDSIRSAVVAHSVRPTAVRKKIAGVFSFSFFAYCSLNLTIVSLSRQLICFTGGK